MNKGNTGSVIVALALFSLSVCAGALEQDDTLARQIDAFLSKVYEADQPGAAVIVARGGEVVFRKGYGLASVELGVAVEPQHVFMICSMTKQFTAAGVMLLVEQGKIGLDDEITRFLPDYPTRGRSIRIRRLLTHTSGIPDYTGMEEWEKRSTEVLSPDEIIDIFKDEPLEFEPGEKWSYSNSGYFLLGRIIEIVSGVDYAEFMRESIFEPLGLEHTFVGDDRAVYAGRVGGYERAAGRVSRPAPFSMSHPYAAGGILSSVDDLAAWNAAIHGGKLLGRESPALCFTPCVLNDGSVTKYGFGWFVDEYKGRRNIYHGGGGGGFTTHGMYLPDDDLYVAVLSNLSDPTGATPVRIVAESVAAIALGEPLEDMATPGIELSAEELNAYVGAYRLDPKATQGLALEIVLEEGKLFALLPGGIKDEMAPKSRTLFAVPRVRAELEFELDSEGRAVKMTVLQGGRRIVFHRSGK